MNKKKETGSSKQTVVRVLTRTRRAIKLRAVKEGLSIIDFLDKEYQEQE